MTQTQSQPRTTTTNGGATIANDPSLLDKVLDATVDYVPFMSEKTVSLSPRLVLRMFAVKTKSGKLPTIEQAAKFCRLCEARALNPWEGDAFLVGYDTKDGPVFNLITAHQAFLKRAEVHPEYDGMESGVVVADSSGALTDQPGDFIANDQTLAGGWARVHFKNRKYPTYRRINLSTFNTGYSRWAVDPGGMIVKVAEADALRSSFPTKLGGMYINEEFDGATPARPSVPMPRGTDEPKPEPLPPPDPESQIPAQQDDPDAQGEPLGEESQEPADVIPMPCTEASAVGLIIQKCMPAGMSEASARELIGPYFKTKFKVPWNKLTQETRVSNLNKWFSEGFPPFAVDAQ